MIIKEEHCQKKNNIYQQIVSFGLYFKIGDLCEPSPLLGQTDVSLTLEARDQVHGMVHTNLS